MDENKTNDKRKQNDAEREMRSMNKALRAVERELPNLSTDSRAWLRARLSTMLVPVNADAA